MTTPERTFCGNIIYNDITYGVYLEKTTDRVCVNISGNSTFGIEKFNGLNLTTFCSIKKSSLPYLKLID